MAAAAALFTARGFAEVTMREIAAGAGVTKGALYHHFTGKEEVFEAVFVREMAAIRSGLLARLEAPAPFRQRLESVAAFLLEAMRPDVVRLVTDRERHVAQPRRGALATQGEVPLGVVRPYFVRAAASGEFTRVAPGVAAALFLAMVLGQARSAKLGIAWDEEAVAPATIVDVLFAGI